MLLPTIGGKGIEDKIEENYHSRRAHIYAVAVLYRGGVCILRGKWRE